MQRSPIEWTDATWNPVTGCTQISPGCANCYAKTFAERFRGVPGHPYERGFDLQLRPGRLDQPLRWRKPRSIFVNSMSDLFHEDVPDDYIHEVFEIMEAANHHRFQVLTKRAERLAQLAPSLPWPDHIWMGVSVENQRWTSRIEPLRSTDAAIKFLSCEPLLGPLDLDLNGIDWVIAGGESGPRARPMHPDWVRAIRDQCQESQTPFFFKQWGAHDASGQRVGKKRAGRKLDKRIWNDMPSNYSPSPHLSPHPRPLPPVLPTLRSVTPAPPDPSYPRGAVSISPITGPSLPCAPDLKPPPAALDIGNQRLTRVDKS